MESPQPTMVFDGLSSAFIGTVATSAAKMAMQAVLGKNI